MEKTKLMYGSYKTEEIEIIEDLFIKNGVSYEMTVHSTNRGLPFHHLYGYCTKEEQDAIRKELAEIIKRKWNWGRMTYKPTV